MIEFLKDFVFFIEGMFFEIFIKEFLGGVCVYYIFNEVFGYVL